MVLDGTWRVSRAQCTSPLPLYRTPCRETKYNQHYILRAGAAYLMLMRSRKHEDCPVGTRMKIYHRPWTTGCLTSCI